MFSTATSEHVKHALGPKNEVPTYSFTITFSQVVENGIGMEKIGEIAEKGFETKELEDKQTSQQNTIDDLNSEINTQKDQLEQSEKDQNDLKETIKQHEEKAIAETDKLEEVKNKVDELEKDGKDYIVKVWDGKSKLA